MTKTINQFKKMNSVFKGIIVGFILFLISMIPLSLALLLDNLKIGVFAIPSGLFFLIMMIDMSANTASPQKIFFIFSLINFVFYIICGALIGAIILFIKKFIKNQKSK